MTSGAEYILLPVDKKGRIHLPKKLREDLGISEHVVAEKESDMLILKPTKKISDPLTFLTSFQIKTKKTPVEMKREAEEGFGR